MTYSALLLGSIGVLSETSDVQRRAFNTAFELNEVDWHWDTETYRALLAVPGGKARLEHYAKAQGAEVDIDAIYDAKLDVFEAALEQGVDLRPGIADLIAEAQAQGMKLGFVTATDPRQVAALLRGLETMVDPSVFDFIANRTVAPRPKPAPDIYNAALRTLEVTAETALAIEDTPESAQAALDAGIRTIGYAGAEVGARSFPDGVEVLSSLHVSLLRERAAAA